MKYLWRVVCLAALISMPIAAGAQTPDGDTPVEETVCDGLKADGITKGLYGLCVAFCEAQDIANEAVPISELALGNILADAPSGKILRNYNKRKQATDPDMPCVLVEEPCPCWTPEELATIDGLDEATNAPHDTFICGLPNVQEITWQNDPDVEWDKAVHYNQAFANSQFCTYDHQWRDRLYNHLHPRTHRVLTVPAGTVTIEQLVTCRAQLVEHCSGLGF